MWYNSRVPLHSLLAAIVLGSIHAPITNIVEVLDAPASWHTERRPFSLTGNIIRFSDKTRNCTLWVHPHAISLSKLPPHITPDDGDLVFVTGHFGRIDGNPRRFIDDVRTIRRGVRPTARVISAAQCDDDELQRSYVRLQGVLVKVRRDALDPRYRYLILRDSSGITTAALPNSMWPACGETLIDAEIRIEGVLQESVGWREGLTPMIMVSKNVPLEVVKAAPTSMSAIPVLKSRQVLHRQKTSGVVLAATDERFFIRPRLGGAAMEVRPCANVPPPKAGASVTVAGFARLDPFHTMLDEALVEIEPNSPVRDSSLASINIRLSDLIVCTNNGERINTGHHGRIVNCRGVVRRTTGDVNSRRFLMTDDHQDITVDMSGIPSESRTPPASGSTIAATGLLLAEFENVDAYASLPAFRRFTLIPRNADEIVVLARPAWWTPARLLAVIVILVVALIAFIIWNRSLQMLSERRGRELFRARFAHAKADLKVEERTHLAVELHDSLSQTLTGVAMQIETAASLTEGGSNPIRKILATAGQMLASCRGELQSCIWDLRSRTFDEKDMTEAVTRTVDTHIGTARLVVRFNVPRSQLSETTTHAILRIVRELAVNAVRHGHATEIRIAGNLDDGIIRFSVADNGTGFNLENAPGPRDGHFGLQGVRERLNEFAGSLKIESQIGEGTRIRVTMKPRDDQ